MNRRRVITVAALVVIGIFVVAAAVTVAQSSGVLQSIGLVTRTSPESASPGAVSSAVQPGEPQSAVLGAPETKDTASVTYSGTASGAVPDSQREVIKTASLTMTVKAVPSAIERLRVLAAASGGEIASLAYTAGSEGAQPVPLDGKGSASPSPGPQSATVVIRVPSSKLDSLTGKLTALGDVTAQSAGQEDVTAQVVDLNARLKNLRAEEVRLRSFLNKAVRVSDMLSIENQLARVRGEIEAMEAQQRYMADQVAMATLTVTMSQPAAVVSPAGTNWGFAAAVQRGIRAAATTIATAVTLIIALSPILAAALLVWWLVALWRRRHRLAPQLATAETTDPKPVD